MRVIKLLALVLTLTLVAAACGTDSVDDLSNGESDGGGDGGTTNTVATPPGSLPDVVTNIPGLSDECEALFGFYLGIAQLVTGGNQVDTSGLLDSSELPGSIQDDIEVVAAAADIYGAMITELEIDFSDPNSIINLTEAQQEQLNQASEAMNTPEVNEALNNIEVYGVAECDNFG